MKRPLTLTSAILGTVFQGILSLSSVILFIELIDYLEGSALTFVLLLTIAIAVLGLIFNILSIPAWNKTPEVFRKKRGFIITAVVFNFVVVVLSLIGYAGGEARVNILSILMLIGLTTASVMFIVDMAIEGKRAAKFAQQNQPAEEVAAQAVATQAGSAPSSLEEKLVKLSQMKEQGIIDEQEYNELKKKYISEML